VDLHQWIASDHASVLTRFDNAITPHVPLEHWKQSGFSAAPSPSIAWLLFHMTYHQDLAMNTAIRNHAPMLEDQRALLGLGRLPPSAGLTEAEDRNVTDALDLEALRAYVDAVVAATSAWIATMSTMALDSVPTASWRLEHKAGIPADGELSWLHSMWADKTTAWFVQWECIGHGHAHVGEMVGIRNRLGLSPH
jgi:DinB superfamily